MMFSLGQKWSELLYKYYKNNMGREARELGNILGDKKRRKGVKGGNKK